MTKIENGSRAEVPEGALLAEPPAPQPRYRVGHHQAQNLYDRDVYIGVMFSPRYAALVVGSLNEAERRVDAEQWSRAMIRDTA
jgi:hypothetical protein